MNFVSRRNMIRSVVYSAFTGLIPRQFPEISFFRRTSEGVFEPSYLKLHRSGELKRRREKAARYSSGASKYPEVTKQALLEMHRQVGVAKPAAGGLMQRGLMIRHLVMPNNTGDSKKIIDWIADNLPADTYLNIMSQYSPTYKAFDYPEISRKITREEYSGVVNHAKAAGLTNLEIQGYRQ